MPCIEELFPEHIAYGATGGAGFSTDIVTSIGGHEQRNANWSLARGRWQVGLQNRTKAETESFIAFFLSVAQGQLNSFRWNDPLDHEFTDQLIGVGDGTTTTFQLVKTYQRGTAIYTRVINKPVPGTLTITLDGTPTIGFTVDTRTGRVTLSPAPANGVALRASASFHVSVRLSIDTLEGVQYVSIDTYSWSDIQLLEVRIDENGDG